MGDGRWEMGCGMWDVRWDGRCGMGDSVEDVGCGMVLEMVLGDGRWEMVREGGKRGGKGDRGMWGGG